VDRSATALRVRRESAQIRARDESAEVKAGEESPAGPAAAAFAAATSEAVAARYPLRARTFTPGRFTRTLMVWYRPSSLPLVE
jgi:hypothetical protein